MAMIGGGGKASPLVLALREGFRNRGDRRVELEEKTETSPQRKVSPREGGVCCAWGVISRATGCAYGDAAISRY